MKTIFLVFYSFTIFISTNITLTANESLISEQIIFVSHNPFSFSDVINNYDKLENQQVFGNLVIPHDSLNPNKQFPLIIGVAGSLGWKSHHLDYLEMYQNLGFATFELNSFKSRDITSTVGEQNQVTTAAMIVDAYKALEVLSNHPLIKKDKISITGWSLGGAVTLFSAWLPLKRAINNDFKFASHLAFYPPCFFELENLEFSESPIHILIGEVDDWTPSAPCVDLVNQLSTNSNIDITVYKDSHHGFDREGSLEINENGYSFKNCMFKLTDEGDVLMNYLNIPMSNAFLQKIGFLFCATRGVTIGGNSDAREQSLKFARDFMIKTLN